MQLKSLLASVCLSTSALLSLSITAHAVTFSLSAGTSGSPNNQGTFSSFPNATTINFNNATVTQSGNGSSTTNTYTFSQSGITTTYTWGGRTPSTRFLTSDPYAPPNPTGSPIVRYPAPSNNTSRYLAVNAENVTIEFSTPMRYFGLNWGYADTATPDSVQFFNGNTNLGTFTGATVFGNEINTTTPAEPSTYVNFTAGSGQTFNKIVLSNNGSSSSGFESDNHSYSTVPFGFSPSLGIVALGILFGIRKLFKRVNNSKLSTGQKL